MQEVHVYIYAEGMPMKESEKWFGYVLECRVSGQSVTREGFGKVNATHNGAVLTAMVRAMGRLNRTCEVHLHAEDEFVLRMLENRLDVWAGNGFLTAKGKAVANQEEWMELWGLSQKQLILSEPGGHAYSGWLKEEIRKRKEKDDV